MPRTTAATPSLPRQTAAALRASCAAELRDALPGALQRLGAQLDAAAVEGLATSLADRVVRRMQAEATIAPTPEWISTQEAANRCGFSRPFVAALLDSGTYEGQIHRTPVGGHRKVRADEFAAFIAKTAPLAPASLPEARQSAVVSEPQPSEPPSAPERAASRVRATALAKKLGLA